MNPIVVKHKYYRGNVEEHSFSSMRNALDFIHILHGEYHLEHVEIIFRDL